MWGPDGLDELLTLANRGFIRVAEQAGALEEVASGLAFRYEIHLTCGEIRQAQGDLERFAALAEQLKLPQHTWEAEARIGSSSCY